MAGQEAHDQAPGIPDTEPIGARLPQEGKDYEEDRAPTRMHRLQVQDATGIEAVQTLRIGRREEDKGRSTPILIVLFRPTQNPLASITSHFMLAVVSYIPTVAICHATSLSLYALKIF